jgi:hypothetical protein
MAAANKAYWKSTSTLHSVLAGSSAVSPRRARSRDPNGERAAGRGYAPRFRRLLAKFGAIMAAALPVRPAGNAYR